MLIRKARVDDAEAIGFVHVQTWKTTYAGIVSDDFLRKLDPARSTTGLRKALSNPEADDYHLVAETDAGRIVGIAWGGHNRDDIPEYDSELYAIYVLEEYQGQGYGKALVRTLGERLLEKGYGSMIIWVLSENPSRGFYESLGGHYVQRRQVKIGEQLLDEVGYGWRDLRSLTEALSSDS
jgi:GNAT superfamily N-acetyltransferase